MDIFLLLVFSAAFIGLVWHGVAWALRQDKKDQAPLERIKSKRQRGRINKAFDALLPDLRKRNGDD